MPVEFLGTRGKLKGNEKKKKQKKTENKSPPTHL